MARVDTSGARSRTLHDVRSWQGHAPQYSVRHVESRRVLFEPAPRYHEPIENATRWPSANKRSFDLRPHRPEVPNSSKPVGLETYDVVEGTVRLNQGLPDEVFRLDWKGTLPETKSLATQRRGFRQRRPRRDPEGIREELKHQLALAEARSQPVEAETPEQRQAHQTLTIQAGLAVAGVALLGGAAWCWRRRR